MKVMPMGVMVGVVRRTVVVIILLLLLLSGVRKSLQEHVLWRNRAERNETSSGAKGEDRQKKWQLCSRRYTQNSVRARIRYASCEFTEQIRRRAWGTKGTWHCIGFPEAERRRPYAGTLEHVSRWRNIIRTSRWKWLWQMILIDRLHGNCLGMQLQSVRLTVEPKVLKDFWELEMSKHLFLQLLSELLGLALFVVVHNHHGGIDLPNGHVTG